MVLRVKYRDMGTVWNWVGLGSYLWYAESWRPRKKSRDPTVLSLGSFPHTAVNIFPMQNSYFSKKKLKMGCHCAARMTKRSLYAKNEGRGGVFEVLEVRLLY